MKLKRKAFTLVELIVVIAILAILAVTSFTVLTKWFNKARDSKRMAAVADIKGSIERYITEPNHASFVADVHDKLTGWDETDVQVTTVMVNDTFLGQFPGMDLQKAPIDPLNKAAYRLGLKYQDNPTQMFDVAATLEYNGDNPEYNAYVQGTYKSGVLSGVENYPGLVVREGLQTANYGSITASNADYVYNGSTGALIPYSLQ